MSQEEFAAAMGVGARTVQRWESGENCPTSLREIKKNALKLLIPKFQHQRKADEIVRTWLELDPPRRASPPPKKKGPATPEELPNRSQSQDSSQPTPPPAVSDHEQACLKIQAVTNDFEQLTLEAKALLQEVEMGPLERPRLFEVRDRCRSVETNFPHQVERFERLLSNQRATTEAARAVLAGLEPDDPDAQGFELDDELLRLRECQVKAGRECLGAWNLLHRKVSEALNAEKPAQPWSFDIDKVSERAIEFSSRVDAVNSRLRQCIEAGQDPETCVFDALKRLKTELEPLIGLNVKLTAAQLARFCETVLSWKGFVPENQIENYWDECHLFTDQFRLFQACQDLDAQHSEMIQRHETLATVAEIYGLMGSQDRQEWVHGHMEDVTDSIQENRFARKQIAEFVFESLNQPENWREWASI